MIRGITSFHIGFLLILLQIVFLVTSIIFTYKFVGNNNRYSQITISDTEYSQQTAKYVLFIVYFVLRNINISLTFHHKVVKKI